MTTKRKRKKTEGGASAAFLFPIRHKPFTPELAAHIRAEQKNVFGRILSAVGEKPANIDIGALAFDIGEACMLVPYEIDPLERSKAKKRLRLVRRIRKHLEKANKLMNSDPYISEKLTNPITDLHQTHKVCSLENLQASLAKEWREKNGIAESLKGRRASRREWLAGAVLPLVYEKHWESRAGRSHIEDKKSGKQRAAGPCVRFIEATLEAIGEPCAADTIARAMTRLKPLRNEYREARAKKEKN